MAASALLSRGSISPGVFAFIVSALVASVLLNAAFCDGGKTSTFVRKVEKAIDMPLDSDVFSVPPGFNSPQQVLLSNPLFQLIILILDY